MSDGSNAWNREMLRGMQRDYENGLFEIVDVNKIYGTVKKNIFYPDSLEQERSLDFKLIFNCRDLQMEQEIEKRVLKNSNKKVNLAEVDYKVTSENRVVVVALRGFLNEKELRTKYGEKVIKEYTQRGSISMVRGVRITPPCVYISCGIIIAIGCEYTFEEYSKIIRSMKLAGERLQKIVNNNRSKDSKIYTDKI